MASGTFLCCPPSGPYASPQNQRGIVSYGPRFQVSTIYVRSPLFKHFNFCYFPYSSLIFSHQFDMSEQLSDSLNIARRPKFEFFDGECKNDIALLAPEWFGLPDTRKDKTRAQWFTKNFDAFRSKHEHKFHPEDRRLLESVSCCILRACPKYLPYVL